HALAGDREKCFQAGMNDYLSKPIIPDRLYAVMSGWIPSAQKPISFERRTPNTPDKMEEAPFAIPHVDVAVGVQRLSGNIALYQELLAEFRNNYGEIMADLRRMAADSDTKGVRIRLHGFKGVCGNLGAESLSEMVQRLETAMAGSRTRDINHSLEQLDVMLRECFSTIDAMERQQPAVYSDAPGKSVNKEQVAEAVDKLADLLERGRLDATKAMTQLEAMLPAEHQPGEFKAMAEAVHRLNFAEAQSHLKRYQNYIQKVFMA
ncbi:MAG: Hpt domain-containing protein, partial [Desulfobacteraceae bacterium]